MFLIGDLNDHNSSITETHEEAYEKVIVLLRQHKIKTLQDYFVCIYFFLFLGWCEVVFLALVDMSYLIIRVDNAIEASYRIILYSIIVYFLLQKLFFFAVFIFNIDDKQQKQQQLIF